MVCDFGAFGAKATALAFAIYFRPGGSLTGPKPRRHSLVNGDRSLAFRSLSVLLVLLGSLDRS